ncbi:prolyl-tRNA synthetase [Candidatus Saccharibacteria bacterium]|nr:prolyl-tRNA synthetase [Candidatus Saccharibacteria bacterium]
MRLSELFTKTRKQVPADESSKNAQLLIQAGFIHKEMAGVYSFLPLGKRVLDNIAQIVRKEMDAVGGQEILMPALQLKERYEKTGRWDDQVVDNWFKTKLVNGAELGLGFSHEENLSPLLKNFLGSYKDLPLMIYQIQTKFRNELRSKSGLLRGREFLMKDMYSFAISQKQHEQVYEKIKQAYYKIYERLGIGQQTFLTFASGGVFTKFSHEFQTLTDAGEDTIYLDRQKRLAINREVISDEVIQNLGLNKKDLEQVRGVEVGNIFSLGTKFSDPFELAARDEQGEPVTLIMGCYGLGISRVMGTIIELLADDKGLVWPETIAPFKVYLARLGSQKAVITAAEELYKVLTHRGITVLYDNRDESAGTKLTDADLMGIPYRLVVSDKTQQNHHYELKKQE